MAESEGCGCRNLGQYGDLVPTLLRLESFSSLLPCTPSEMFRITVRVLSPASVFAIPQVTRPT